MHRAFLLAALLATGACGSSEAMRAPPPKQSSLTVATTALRDNLLSAHATFDGALITDVRPTGRCDAVILTAAGSSPVKWKNLGDLIGHTKGDQMIFDIPAGVKTHILSFPSGETAAGFSDTATRIRMGLGLLDRECGGVLIR